MGPDPGDRRVEFKYDYLSRRVEKKSLMFNGFAWAVQEWQRFVYDGWNVVMVLDAKNANQIVRKYTWGLDLSGWSGGASPSGVHGAGGIGGLLAGVETAGTHQGSYWFCYDANGNVGQVLNATNPQSITIAAHYEYDPYGNTVAKSGIYADYNPFRFSTKWLDAETGLYYYGYRYLDPRFGRWTSRELLENPTEQNLYEFVRNDPARLVDIDGRQWSPFPAAPVPYPVVFPPRPPRPVPPPASKSRCECEADTECRKTDWSDARFKPENTRTLGVMKCCGKDKNSRLIICMNPWQPGLDTANHGDCDDQRPGADFDGKCMCSGMKAKKEYLEAKCPKPCPSTKDDRAPNCDACTIARANLYGIEAYKSCWLFGNPYASPRWMKSLEDEMLEEVEKNCGSTGKRPDWR